MTGRGGGQWQGIETMIKEGDDDRAGEMMAEQGNDGRARRR